MTNEEIKKALDKELRCAEYAQEEYADCVKVSLLEEILNLITTQEILIERLKTENEKRLNVIEDFTNKTCCLKCDIARILVKEFAEKLKEKKFNKDMFNDWAGATYVILVRDIDVLLKQYGVEV